MPPEQDTEPAGSEEHLKNAICILAGGNILSEDDQYKLTWQLREIAQRLLSDLDEKAKGYRVKHARADLIKIQRRAFELHNAMLELHPIVSTTLRREMAADSLTTTRPLMLLIEEAWRALDALGPDRGGNRTLETTIRWGFGKRKLVHQCADLLIAHRGVEACTATEGAALHRLVCEVWGYATGRDGEDTGLIRYVRETVHTIRQDHPLSLDQVHHPP